MHVHTPVLVVYLTQAEIVEAPLKTTEVGSLINPTPGVYAQPANVYKTTSYNITQPNKTGV